VSEPRELPAHIQAQLASAGRQTDTGGQPWEGRDLGEGTSHVHGYPEDDGRTPAGVAEALGKFARAELPEEGVVAALAGTRLFAPILAEVSRTELTEDGLVSDKEADMSLVSISAPDGRKALPVFTRVDALTDWHPQARPVAADARKTALAAVEDGNQLMVVNPGAELTFVLRRPALWALAKGERWLPSYSDPRVQAALEACAAADPLLASVGMTPGRGVASRDAEGRMLPGGGPGPELGIELGVRPGLDRAALDAAVTAFQERLRADEVVAERVDSMELRLRSA
jgi:hypothetical protein